MSQFLSVLAQGLQGSVQNELYEENPQDSLSSLVVGVAVTILTTCAIIWCHRQKRRAPVPIQENVHSIHSRHQQVKRKLRQERQEPSQSIDPLDGPSNDKEDNFLSCSRERTKLLHTMSAQILSQSMVKKHQNKIQIHAFLNIEMFISNGNNQRFLDFRFLIRKFVFYVFSDLFSGSNYRGYSEDIVKDADNLLKHKRKNYCDDTFIGYMQARPEQFSPSQIRRTLISLMLGMHATTANVVVSTMNLWAKNPEKVKQLRLINDPEQFSHKLNKYILESMRMEPPPGTMMQRGINLSEFLDHPDMVGVEPWNYHPDRFNDENECIEKWRLAPWMPFSFGPNACPGEKFAQSVITVFFEMLLSKFEFRVLDDHLDTRDLGKITGFELRRKNEELENASGGWI